MPMRITGMSSGLDIDKMVSDLMKAERMPLTKMTKKKTQTSWTMGLYREINTKLSSFKSVVDDMKLSGDWKATKAASTNAAVTVSSDGSSNIMNHTITVDRLASGASKSSSSAITNDLVGSSLTGTTSIDSSNNKFDITVNGIRKTITLTPNASYTPATLRDEINTQLSAAFGAAVSVSLTGASNDQLKFNSTGQVTLSDVAGNNGLTALGFAAGTQRSNRLDSAAPIGFSGNMVINGKTVAIGPGDSLSNIMTKVNTSAAGVTMSYDVASDKVIFTSKGTGSTAKVDLTGTDSSILAGLKFADSSPVYGQDASVQIDGVQYYEQSNTFTKSGITYTLNQTTPPATVVNVSVTKDTEALFNKIVNFVAKYNETVELMGKRLNEDKYRGYDPLSDDEKKDMKEADIKLWEEKAKSGLIRRDSIVSKTLSSLRRMTSETVEGVTQDYNALYKIGITTMPYNINKPEDAAKLTIDETKLKQALASDPDSVIAMFTNFPADSGLSEEAKYKQKGIAQRMFDQIGSSINELSEKAGKPGTVENDINTTLGSSMKTFERKIADLEAKMKKKENNYYVMFAQMEKAIQKSNAQSSWLAQRM
ncbi:flagellar filament capping protein FliD [Paenibacillus ehimensis]|uniref:flagellar filament capping protein FliD n=1 Tax=Paenibacillus ehimensis TaxID=79264 RepID=UPI003D2AF92A